MASSRSRKSPIDVEEIIRTNPKVNPGLYRETAELLGELRKRGVTPREYGLGSPYQQRPLDRTNKDKGGAAAVRPSR